MSESPIVRHVRFVNFKCLADTTLQLEPFTLLIGPNGSGKSTALEGLRAAGSGRPHAEVLSVGADKQAEIRIEIEWGGAFEGTSSVSSIRTGAFNMNMSRTRGGGTTKTLGPLLNSMEVFSLAPKAIAGDVRLEPGVKLQHDGTNLAGVLDQLRDRDPEGFEELHRDLARWLPEFDRILFATPHQGMRSIVLRTRDGHQIPARALSDGTLFALTLLTIAHIPDPPELIGFEDPNHGMHPRLLQDVRDALYKLAYPSAHGSSRKPVQVIATTHSPYFLDLFKEHAGEVVIAQKVGSSTATFERLADREDLREMIGDLHLGEAWYSGILGGTPTRE